MKKFTKGALITALVCVVLGVVLCAVGAGIGFHYSSIPRMAKDGAFNFNGNWKVWRDWSETEREAEEKTEVKTERYEFSADEIRNLNIDMDCADVEIKETADSRKIQVEVKYQRNDAKNHVLAAAQDDVLDISESEVTSVKNNGEIQVTLRIPEGKEFNDVNLQNDVGSVIINCKMNAQNCNIRMDTGKCNFNNELKVAEKLYAEVDVGRIGFERIEAGEMELYADVGKIEAELAAADKSTLNCDVGEIDVVMEGAESDYNYYTDCNIGNVKLGRHHGGREQEIRNHSHKNIDISCDIGKVKVEFTK